MNFADSVRSELTPTRQWKMTENGAAALSTVGSNLLDLFGTIGALRPRTETEIAQKFATAFTEDKRLATRMMFYCGNVRGGLGERRTFRVCLKWMAITHPEIVIKNMALIPLFNRWDSLFVLVGTSCEKHMWGFIEECIKEDLMNFKAGKSISLLAKWMPSENASSVETKRLARRAIHQLRMSSRSYRKMLSALRKYLDITERKMSAQDWNEIKYSAVPSYAMKNYSEAFKKHDADRFISYLNSVKKGEKKINASTLYPYDLVHKVWSRPDEVAELQWNALPNYVEGENNYLVMADVSGSMWGRPIETSIGLATYFAQHNKGAYHNLYMSFTNDPHFISLKDNMSLHDAVRFAQYNGVGYSTNLMAAFDNILAHAVRNHIAEKDMPKALIVVSDMEINHYFRPGCNWDFLQTVRAKFAAAGYSTPDLYLWNVEARNDTFLTDETKNVYFISGQSASMFKQICNNLNGKTAYQLMLDTLNDRMYDCVTI